MLMENIIKNVFTYGMGCSKLGKDKIHRNACPSFHELQMSIEREIPEGGF